MNIAPRPLSPLESTLAENAPVAVAPFAGLLCVSPWHSGLCRSLGGCGPTFKRSNVQTCQRKSFIMHFYEIAYALTPLESHSYRKTGGVGGLIVNQNQPSLPFPPYLTEYKHVTSAFVTTSECRLSAEPQCLRTAPLCFCAGPQHRTSFAPRRCDAKDIAGVAKSRWGTEGVSPVAGPTLPRPRPASNFPALGRANAPALAPLLE